MTREEVKVVFTGLAHDHLMATSAMHHPHHNNHNQHHQHHHHQHKESNKRSSHHLDERDNHIQHQHHHHHHHHHHEHAHHPHNTHHHAPQPLGGCTSENLPKGQQRRQDNINAAGDTSDGPQKDAATALSTIAILRRHPMYDSLVLVKKYRPCLGGYSLEFPTENDNGGSGEASSENASAHESEPHANCGRTKLVSVYLDGDDPIYQSQQETLRKQREQLDEGSASCSSSTSGSSSSTSGDGEVVYVPVNGLMDRLRNYDRHGIAIDSRVYAFAIGLKTAERFLTSSTVKEMQEAPPL